MAHTAPTPANLKTRYSAFAGVADVTVQYWLTDAERYVDTTWAEGDYAPALMALAAHHMKLDGLGTQTAAGALPAGVTRFKSGTMDVTVSDSAASAAAEGSLRSTRYGLEFLAIRRRNFAGPRIVVAGTVPACGFPVW